MESEKDVNASDTVKSTSTPKQSTDTIGLPTGTLETQQLSIPLNCQTSICSLVDFRAKASVLPEKDRDLTTPGAHSFFEIARVLEAKRPGYILLENVKGLLSHDGGKTFATILGVLADIGYDLQWQVLNSKDFGVPQNRERVFIVGYLGGYRRPEVFPIGESPGNTDEGREQSAGGLRAVGIDANYGKGPDGKRTMIMQAGHNNIITGIRRLTPIECERLQGFPDNWTKWGLFDDGIRETSDTQRYKMCGNAVTTNVVEAIIERFVE